MSTIGKGSRFLSLTGPLRGQEGTAHELADGGSWPLMFDAGKVFYFDVATLEGPSFRRLADGPAEADPLLVELATVEAERFETWGGPEQDARRDPEEWLELLGDEVRERDDAETPAEIREGLLMIAAIALAGVRALDRRATRHKL